MKTYLCFLGILMVACSTPHQVTRKIPRINELADSYYDSYLFQFPESAYWYGVESQKHDEFDVSIIKDIRKWESYEDSLYGVLRKIDINGQQLSQTEQITYWMLKEALESSIGMRQCKLELWANLNHTDGLHQKFIRLASVQPVGTAELRKQALRRWDKVPDRIQTEISNLRLGLSRGYSMPKVIVNLVIEQLNTLQKNAFEASPFMSPALRDKDSLFTAQWKQLVKEKIHPALNQYTHFLTSEYLPAARDRVSILAIPNGTQCYQAFIRQITTLSITPDEIFEKGTALVSANSTKATALGQSLYSINDLESIIHKVEKDSANYFKTKEEILDFANRKLTQSKERSSAWFAKLPSKEVMLKPILEYEDQNAGYSASYGSNPAYFRISLQNPQQQLKGNVELTAIHEAYPGHHLQIGIAQDINGLHPITKIIYNSGFNEGWARYSEQLAEEMGLYEDQITLVLRLAWPARGMVIDPGIHLKNWSLEEVTRFCKEAGVAERGPGAYYRSIIWPGQLTAYDLGGEEFKALRKMAENKLKGSFDIREFHAKVLENGTVPLSMVRRNIEKWMESKSTNVGLKSK